MPISGLKKLLFVLPVLGAGLAWGQGQGGPDGQQMERAMQGMGEMMACMQKVDQQEMRALGERAQAMEKEMKALCAEGRRDEAQQRAMEFGSDMAQSESFQQLRECGEMAQQALAQMPDYSEYYDSSDGDGSPPHVCDNL